MTDSTRDDVLNRFRAALNVGDVAVVHHLLTNEPIAREHVDAPIFSFGARPLSVGKRSDAMTDLLLAHGADINGRSDWWAGSWGLLDGADRAVAQRLIARGTIVDVWAAAHLDDLPRLTALLDADPSLVHAKGGDGCRPLHFARSTAAIDLLLSRGADIDARDVDHLSTAAQWNVRNPSAEETNTIFRGSNDAVRALIERGTVTDVFMLAAVDDVGRLRDLLDANPSAIARRVNAPGYPPCPIGPGEHIYTYTLGAGATPHSVAADFGSAASLQLLLDRSPPAMRFIAACTSGDAATAHALVAADPSLVSTLLPADATALPQAASRGKTAAVRLLLEFGVDPLTPGPGGATALHWAAWHGWRETVDAIVSYAAADRRRDAILNATEPSYHAKPLGWCGHGSANCRNPKGDYAAVAAALRQHGATE